ncbi:hypothetical protein J3R82DRAFT_4813 [Butyriboletus roseoflavus]|nr:hypothetical protein J3R82DRAFT_4813 [Butyriboletus roseoflavus]
MTVSLAFLVVDFATRQGFSKVVEYLTSKAVPSPSTIMFTALGHQVWMIPSLIRNGVNLHRRDDTGVALLHVAMSVHTEAQCRMTTELLVEAGCVRPFNANQHRIRIAISRGFFSVVVYLLSHAFDAKVSLRLDLSNREYLQLLSAVLKIWPN